MRKSLLAAALLALAAHSAVAAEKVALAGTVSSAAEGKMEGVVVTAQAMGSPISVSVVSDAEGHYAFPADRLAPGRYALTIRAVGYDLDGAPKAEIAKNETATLALTLDRTRNLPDQLTNAEWMMSIPGTERQKAELLNCNSCHTIERIMLSTHDAEEWANTVPRMMQYSPPAQPIKPVVRPHKGWGGTPDQYRALAAYLAAINLSKSDTWSYPLKTLPRPKGEDTRVIVTEYRLPRPTIEPHDVIVDSHGIVWYSDFGDAKLGRLDPRTGKVTEFDTPIAKPGANRGALDLEIDPVNHRDLWMGLMFQAAIVEFDPAQKKFVRVYKIPAAKNSDVAETNMLGLSYKADGKIWTTNAGNHEVYRIDLKTGTWETFTPLDQLQGKGHAMYGIATDAENDFYWADYSPAWNWIGRIDAKTGKVTHYETPTLRTRPRRMQFDAQGHLWFAEYGGNGVGELDPKSGKIVEWKMPLPYFAPYYVTTDRTGDVWTGGMSTDRVVRIDPKTGEMNAYLMPGDTNIRRVFVDNRTNPPTFWAGANHSATIVKVEPLD